MRDVEKTHKCTHHNCSEAQWSTIGRLAGPGLVLIRIVMMMLIVMAIMIRTMMMMMLFKIIMMMMAGLMFSLHWCRWESTTHGTSPAAGRRWPNLYLYIIFYNYIHIISAGWPNIFFPAGDSIEVKRSRWETNLNIDTHALLQKGKWDGKSLKISHRQSWSKVHKKVTRLHHRRHHHHQQHSVADFLKAQFAIFRQNFVGSCYFFLLVVANCYNARIQRREQSFSLV